MASDFSRTLALLRREKKISQRTAAGDLGVSQALLSPYENGLREPGLPFVVRALIITVYPVIIFWVVLWRVMALQYRQGGWM